MRTRFFAPALAVAIVVVGAGPAFAHTEFDPDEAAPGSVVVVTLVAADERDDASITKVELSPPTEFTVTMADPLAATEGWTGTVLADRAEWTGPPADGDQSFTITLGPVPDEAGVRLQFGAIVTYDNGEVDRWIEDFPIDGAEPEMPGPVLDVVEGATGDGAETGDEHAADDDTSTTLEITPLEAGDDTGDEAVSVTAEDVDEGDDSSNTGIIVAVMVVGVIAIGAGIYFIRRRGSA